MQRIVVAAKPGCEQPWPAQAAAELAGIEAAAHTLSGPIVRSVLLFAEDRDAP